MIIIVPITKEEAMFIRERCPRVHVSKPTTHGKRFMEEHPAAMKLLREFRADTDRRGGKK